MSTGSASPETRTNYRALTPYTPYITQWSEKRDPPHQLVEHRGRGIAYLDETVTDRDSRGVLWFRTPSRPGHGQPLFAKVHPLRQRGVLWFRTPSRPGHGQPLFAKVHPLRQRRAMQRLLCNVCARPADQTDDGVLWLLRDFRDDWPGWPRNMGAVEPPVCVPCVRVATRMCPALRKGAVAVRVGHAPIAGVRGTLYRSGGLAPVAVGEVTVAYEDSRIRWVRAINLVRELQDCTLVEVAALCRS